MAITSAFQADDAGSIPATRSSIWNKPYCIAALAYFLLRGSRLFWKSILFSGYDLRPGVASVLIFLRQQNGALSVEILYFLAGLVMHHPGVVNNTKEVSLSARVVYMVV